MVPWPVTSSSSSVYAQPHGGGKRSYVFSIMSSVLGRRSLPAGNSGCRVSSLGSSSPAWGRLVRVVHCVHARHGVIAQRVPRPQQVASVAVERTVRRCVRQQRQYGATHALQSPCGAPGALQDVQAYLASLQWEKREFTRTVRGLVCAGSSDAPSSVCLGGKSGGQETQRHARGGC